ncbi:MAG: hydroxymethylglutaryl-CoA reductase [Candidatus Micrarchaeales archaeon]|jgi:hydroxymethylglutaryl-CoA reductase (NADPH)
MIERRLKANDESANREEVAFWVERLLRGEQKAHTLETDAFQNSKNPVESAAEIRRKYLERKYGSELCNIASTIINYEDADQRNVENMIGGVQLPLSYVEAWIDGEYAKKDKQHVIYLATTEGRLVAGITRGIAAINESGGARTRIIKEGMTRSDIIETGGIDDSMKIIEFAKSEEGRLFLKSTFEGTSRHCEFVSFEPTTTGRLLFPLYRAKSKAALGMNMITIASTTTTQKLVERMNGEGIKCRLTSESGNMEDKKQSMMNVIKGRGISIVAEATIPKEVVRRILKAEPEDIVNINYSKNYVGSSLAGSIVNNAHVANVLAATFIAYGQDVAQIVDGSAAFDDAKLNKEGSLYFSVYLPALEIGTYGGGTRRETQKELLKSSEVYGEGDEKGATKLKLAELIASVCLAGELNLLAAEATGRLASSHATLKRK